MTKFPLVHTATDNFVTTINNENKRQHNVVKSTAATALKSQNPTTAVAGNNATSTSPQKKRNSTLGDMKSFLASFNKQQDKTRQLLSDMKTPTNTHSTPSLALSSVKKNTLKKNHLLKTSATGGTSSSPMKRTISKSQSVAAFLASDHHYENNHSSMSPSQSSWIEGLRRMREEKKQPKKRSGLTPGQQTPSSIQDQCPEKAHKKERTRLARRLSTLSFPMKACMAALEENNGDIEKSVALLLRWYPKGSGGRGAVQNLVKIILGAEKKLKSLRGKLQILYAPEMDGNAGDQVGDMTDAVRNIFNKYDVDGSGTIDHQEFRKMMEDLGVEMTRAEFQEAITMLDQDHNGLVDFEEFLGWWKQNAGNGVVLSSDIDSLFQHVLSEAKLSVEADKASLLLVDHHKGELWSRICEDDITIRMPMYKGIAGHVVKTGQVLNVPDAHVDPRFNPTYDRQTGYRTKQILAVPIVGDALRPDSRGSNHGSRPNSAGSNNPEMAQVIYGVVEVINSKDDRKFSDADQHKLIALIDRIRHGVVNVVKMQNKKYKKEEQEAKNLAQHEQHVQQRAFTKRSTPSNVLPVIFPLSPKRNRPSSSPSKTSKYKKTLRTETNTARRHTYESASNIFDEAAMLSKEERLSYLNYKSTQLTQRNQQRKRRGGNVVNKMASMLAHYDQKNGIPQQQSPASRSRSVSLSSLRMKVFPKL